MVLTDEEEIIDPLGKLRGVYPHVMALEFENARTQIALENIAMEPESAALASPYALFSEFFLEMNGSVMNAAQCQIVRELLELEDEA